MAVSIKRIYEPALSADGYRVLVDRLWPRGVSKERAALDLWLKDVAPSPELREWFGHKPERFKEFAAKYEHELSNSSTIADLRTICKQHKQVTLLYAAHDPEINHAVVLRSFLAKQQR